MDPNNIRIGTNPSSEGEYTSEDQVVKPTQNTIKTTKDFKKILSKNSRDQKDEEDEYDSGPVKKKEPTKLFGDTPLTNLGSQKEKDDEENATAGMSLFDLSSRGAQNKGETPKPHGRIAKAESPADMFKHMSAKEIKTEEPVEKPAKFTTRYTPEQPDLSYINPLANATPNLAPVAPAAPAPKPVMHTDIAALVEQIVKSMYTVETQGRTDTVITLQNPPLFKDAQIVISAFDTARGQFNISFENLTQAAQKLLSQDTNRTSLINALHEKGYGVQILTITTQIENAPLPIDDPLRDHHHPDQDPDQQQQQRRQQRDDDT